MWVKTRWTRAEAGSGFIEGNIFCQRVESLRGQVRSKLFEPSRHSFPRVVM